MRTKVMSPEHYDIVGIGFGPANLALALALTENEQQGGRSLSALFLERQQAFGWHRGMLIEEGAMQISFLKDLVTLRNPQSAYSFVNYLKQRGRLCDFINLRTFYPSRIEFHDYLAWCAQMVDDHVAYGREVLEITPVYAPDRSVCHWMISTRCIRTGEERKTYAKTVVLARGISPVLPPNVTEGPRVWHASRLNERLKELSPQPGESFVVVGAGQSAAEALKHIHNRFPDAPVHAILPKYGYSPADDSPFINRLFDPQEVDAFFNMPSALRSKMLKTHGNTNYGVVDSDLIESIYQDWYLEQVTGKHKLHFHRHTQLVRVEECQDRVRSTICSLETETEQVMEAGYLVCATGYRASDPMTILSPEARALVSLDDGATKVTRHYELTMGPSVDARIFVQEDREETHGLSATLLSNLSIRSGEILAALQVTP